MAEEPQLETMSLPGLLKLPNELLLEIASSLSIPDLRRLSRANQRLYYFICDYLVRHRYNAGLIRLPNELLLQIAQHLGTQKDRSRLARVSQKFYPPVMDYIMQENVRHFGSSLLIFAARWDLKGMAQKILYIGGDVDTQSGFQRIKGERSTPLTIAAHYGYERMVRLFLEAEACQVFAGIRVPLALALEAKHESAAMLLSKELHAEDKLDETGVTVLRIACEARAVKLVRHLLEREPRRRTDDRGICNRSTALFCLLNSTGCEEDFIKRGLPDDVFQIAKLLLQHNADPDMYVEHDRFTQTFTARYIASDIQILA